jgi:hypothetical protein
MIERQVARKKIELKLKLASLEEEIKSWCDRSDEDKVFEKHNTQIRALQAHLKGWHAVIEKRLAKYNNQAPDLYLTNCANAEKIILSEHRIWDFFRSKLIQREEDSFLPYLRAADEFVWNCYQPILKIVYPDVVSSPAKQPPLVFFNGGISPFSLSRGKSFQPEQVAGEVLNINPDEYVTKLPIPVVGVPWDQVSHLPAVLVLGHEVGHIVEDDFRLEAELKQMLKNALEQRKADATRTEAWNEWLGEIFADLYGCLAAGPAFAGALIDFIANGKQKICSEAKIAPGWGRYPTDFLRVQIVLKALELMGFDETPAAVEYRELWNFYSSGMDQAYTYDVPVIVKALLEGKHTVLGNRSIMEVFSFSKVQQEAVDKLVEKFSDTPLNTIVEIPSKDIRVLFAALRRAFETNPDKYEESEYGEAVLTHIANKVIQKGVRAGEDKLDGPALNKKLAVYESGGADLVESLFAAAENR